MISNKHLETTEKEKEGNIKKVTNSHSHETKIDFVMIIGVIFLGIIAYELLTKLSGTTNIPLFVWYAVAILIVVFSVYLIVAMIILVRVTKDCEELK